MSFLERLKIGIAAFKGTAGLRLPVNGRSSDETMSGSVSSFLAGIGSLNPIVDFEMLRTLKYLMIYNPDVSQYVANIVNLGNPGHQITIDAATDAQAETAVNRLNESASRIYTIGCGVDGLLNQYLTSVAWSGAISSEDVVNLAGRRVEKVVLVPVEQIRFRYNKEIDGYDAYQRSSGSLLRSDRTVDGLVKLNPETYKYLALSTIENSPYAKPPATAAVEPILEGQKPLMENLRYIAQKFGLLGLVLASVTPPNKKPSETQSEYETRAAAYLATVNAALNGNFSKGLITAFRDVKFEHTNIAEGAKGLYDVNRISEEQVFSGLGAMPGFHGRTDSTTETFADVVYYLLTAQVGNMQRPVKRRMEATYRLDLRLGGIEVDGVSLAFDKAHSRNAKAEAETDEIVLRTVLSKVEKGLIDPDEGAQELGYESWSDVSSLGSLGSLESLGSLGSRDRRERRTLTVSFDNRKQRYEYQREAINLTSPLPLADNVVRLQKKKGPGLIALG